MMAQSVSEFGPNIICKTDSISMEYIEGSLQVVKNNQDNREASYIH